MRPPRGGSVRADQEARRTLGRVAAGTVGFMDSGLGGLSVLRHAVRLAPRLSYVYFADTAYCPYGSKSTGEVRDRVGYMADRLLDAGCGVLVLACNTASAAALEWLRARVSVPVVGMEPAVKPAALGTRAGRIGVLATPATLRAERFSRLVDRYARDVQVVTQAAPEFVEAVEAGRLSGPEVEALVGSRLRSFRQEGVDTLVLGCTHYPFLEPVIRKVVGPDVAIVDPGPAVARRAIEVRRAFYGGRGEGDAVPPSDPERRVLLLTSGECEVVARGAARLCPELVFDCQEA